MIDNCLSLTQWLTALYLNDCTSRPGYREFEPRWDSFFCNIFLLFKIHCTTFLNVITIFYSLKKKSVLLNDPKVLTVVFSLRHDFLVNCIYMYLFIFTIVAFQWKHFLNYKNTYFSILYPTVKYSSFYNP